MPMASARIIPIRINPWPPEPLNRISYREPIPIPPKNLSPAPGSSHTHPEKPEVFYRSTRQSGSYPEAPLPSSSGLSQQARHDPSAIASSPQPFPNDSAFHTGYGSGKPPPRRKTPALKKPSPSGHLRV